MTEKEYDVELSNIAFYVSYKANDVFQAIIVNAPYEEAAKDCFKNSRRDAELIGCREATDGDIKPGIHVMNANKYYKVVITHCALLGLTAGHSYTHWADKMPEKTTENVPMKDVHTAYFTDPVEAEDYRVQCMKDLGANVENHKETNLRGKSKLSTLDEQIAEASKKAYSGPGGPDDPGEPGGGPGGGHSGAGAMEMDPDENEPPKDAIGIVLDR